jgi:hypothetical protein
LTLITSTPARTDDRRRSQCRQTGSAMGAAVAAWYGPGISLLSRLPEPAGILMMPERMGPVRDHVAVHENGA